MTSPPQTHQRSCAAQESRPRTGPTSEIPADPESSGGAPQRARPALPALDPAAVFGCVDWFLYPSVEPRAAAQA
jgi:hypothetical protein